MINISESHEEKIKKTNHTEKLLEREKRNKRKSKVFNNVSLFLNKGRKCRRIFWRKRLYYK